MATPTAARITACSGRTPAAAAARADRNAEPVQHVNAKRIAVWHVGARIGKPSECNSLDEKRPYGLGAVKRNIQVEEPTKIPAARV